jgi:hypothetical protein
MLPSSAKVYRRKMALFTQGASTVEPMADRRSQSPHRTIRVGGKEAREFYRGLQREQVQAMREAIREENALSRQMLQTMIDRLTPQDRRCQGNEENRSVAGSQGAQRTRSWTADRPTRPSFLREEAPELVDARL